MALYLENFNRLNCTLAVLLSALAIDSSLLPSLVSSLKCLHFEASNISWVLEGSKVKAFKDELKYQTPTVVPD